MMRAISTRCFVYSCLNDQVGKLADFVLIHYVIGTGIGHDLSWVGLKSAVHAFISAIKKVGR